MWRIRRNAAPFPGSSRDAVSVRERGAAVLELDQRIAQLLLGLVRADQELRAVGEQLRIDRLAQEVARASRERAFDHAGAVEPGGEHDRRARSGGQMPDRLAQRDAVAPGQLGIDQHERGTNSRQLSQRTTGATDIDHVEIRSAQRLGGEASSRGIRIDHQGARRPACLTHTSTPALRRSRDPSSAHVLRPPPCAREPER